MTADGLPGRPVGVWLGGRRRDYFARGPGDDLLHWWDDGAGIQAESAGGSLLGDPVAVSRRPGRVDVFARGRGSVLLHWWADDDDPHLSGPEPPRPGWRCSYDPAAYVFDPSRVDVIAQSADDNIRRWWTVDNDWGGPENPDASSGPPALLWRAGAEPDWFGRDRDGKLRALGEFHRGEGRTVDALAGSPLGRPVAVSDDVNRVDVLAVNDDLDIAHWGWSGTEHYWDNPEHTGPDHYGRWYADGAVISGPFRPEIVVLGGGVSIDAYATRADGTLEVWHWDGTQGFLPHNEWRRTAVLGQIRATPSLCSGPDGPVLIAWGPDGDLVEWAGQQSQSRRLPLPDTTVVPPRPPTVLPPPACLMRRADDLVVLGVDFGRYIAVTFPPQHVAEEVSPSDILFPSDNVAGYDVWNARASGPSRLLRDFTVPAWYSVSGLLGLILGEVSPRTDDAETLIELPAGLTSTLPAPGTMSHATDPVPSGDVVGLWHTRIGAAGLLAVDYGVAHPFSVPLGLAARQQIVAAGTPADVRRLELTALGGSLTARGRWPAFDWDHEANLGRDVRVRTLTRGILYPFGHRAEYVEITDRAEDPTDVDPIAVLRVRRVLIVTEPVRGKPDRAELACVFPFDECEIAVASLSDLDDPNDQNAPLDRRWRNFRRPVVAPDDLVRRLAGLEAQFADDPVPPGDWVSGWPDFEDLVTDERAGAWAEAKLALLEEISVLRQQVDAIRATTPPDVPWYFVPHSGGTPVRFPVVCRQPGTQVAFDTPLVFVIDEVLTEPPTLASFDSLNDGDVATKLVDAYRAVGGLVDLPGVAVQLVPGPAPTDSDVQVLRRLNLVGVRDGRGFRPRLGPPDEPDDGGAPTYAADWGFEADLPQVRALLPNQTQAHTALLRFAVGFAEANGALEVPFAVASGAPLINFGRDADRSGGLVSPVIRVTGVSREAGLIDLAGRTDPTRMVTSDATLLGVPLGTLLAGVRTPPTITAGVTPGGVPTATLSWPAKTPNGPDSVPLTGGGPLRAIEDGPPPSMTLDVVVTGPDSTTTCTVRNFQLLLPEHDPLLLLAFEAVTYQQAHGQPPTLKIAGMRAKFMGDLGILAVLQDKVGLGGALPQVDVTADGIVARYALPIPEASLLAFVIRNATFTTELTVPFRGDPVRLAIGFASRAQPFALSVLLFGGGGYVAVKFDGGQVSRFEIALEFGAVAAVDFVVARGEAHILGGIHFELVGGAPKFAAYVRVGGSLEILGLISVSVEMVIELDYRPAGNRLTGRATLVLELDLTLWSDSVTIDSGEWVISGGEPAAPRMVAGPRFSAVTDRHTEDARAWRKAFA